MTQFLVRLFIKDDHLVQDPQVREKHGKLAGAVGIITNLFLFAVKLLAGFLVNSISIMADAINNLSDAASSVVTLVGFKLAAQPADKEHPFGHARYEYIAGLIVSFVILLIGVQLIQSSVNKILNPEPVLFTGLTGAILLASIVLKLWQSHFNKTIGEKISSLALIATAADSRNDVLATSAVLISALISAFSDWQLDGYMGLAVALFIIYSGVNLIRDTIHPLLGTTPDKELVEAIQEKIMSYEGIIGHHELIVHNYGPGRCFATVHAEVPLSQDIMVSHDLIDQMEEDFLKEMDLHLVAHMDPINQDDNQTRHLYQHMADILQDISSDIVMHDFRVMTGPTHTNLIFDVAIDFDFPLNDQVLEKQIREKVSAFNPIYHPVVKITRSFI